jgi:DUF4097 and DUF4098 domain-containing protein YvlB
MRSRPLLLLLAFLSLSLLASADEWNKSFNLNGKPELRVQTGDANIRVEPWDKGTVEIHVTTQNWKIGEDGLSIIDHQNGNSVSLDVPTARNEIHFGWNYHSRRRVDIVVRMPREARLDLHTQDGNIVVRDMKGEFTLKSGDGHQQIEHVDGTLNAGSGDGSIELTGRFDRLNVTSGDGAVDARVLPGSKMATDWSMRAGDGSIHLQLPSDFSADLEALTSDGHIDFEMPVQMSGRIGKRVHGKLNGGGALLNLHTGDGSIRVDKLEGTI